MSSLISPESSTLLWGVLLAIVGLGFWSEQHTRVGRLLSGVVVSISLAALLSNLRLIPFAAPVYDTVFSSLLPLAIPLLLFRTDLRRLLRTGGLTLVAFTIGVVGVLLGVALATVLVPLGGLSAIVAGLYSATYIGGSINFAAVAVATDFHQAGELTALLAADLFATILQTIVLVSLPGIAIVQRLFGVAGPAGGPVAAAPRKPFLLRKLDLAGTCLALAMAFGLVAAGEYAAAALDMPATAILITSALALAIGTFAQPLVERMSGDFEIGTFLAFLFVVAIGAGADVWVLFETGPVFLAYAVIVLAVHTLFLLAVAALTRPVLRLDIRAVVIGSTACVGGLSTAAAIASARGWRDLVAPGIIAGTLGNAVGTFLGLLMWHLLQ
jgi:uncharacterized membrane protein